MINSIIDSATLETQIEKMQLILAAQKKKNVGQGSSNARGRTQKELRGREERRDVAVSHRGNAGPEYFLLPECNNSTSPNGRQLGRKGSARCHSLRPARSNSYTDNEHLVWKRPHNQTLKQKKSAILTMIIVF